MGIDNDLTQRGAPYIHYLQTNILYLDFPVLATYLIQAFLAQIIDQPTVYAYIEEEGKD
jgi:hypothetical protein